MIFKNREIGKEITVDLDTFFFYFVRPKEEVPEGEKQGITLSSVRERLKRLDPIIDSFQVIAYYRRSSNDHVHLRLRFPENLSVLDGFLIRAWMLDDQTRLSLDLARYLLTDSLHEMNRCFDEKATLDGTKKAGPWIPLDTDRDQYTGSAREDWTEYLTRWTVKQPAQRELIIGSRNRRSMRKTRKE